MRFASLNDAKKYANELLPTKASIYRNGSTIYSNFKMLALRKELAIAPANLARSGILQELSLFWHAGANDLKLYSYETHTTETITNFASTVMFVRCFKPTPGIFSTSVSFCMLVVTETDLLVYAFSNGSISNTDFSVRLPSPVSCLEIFEGKIYVGCQNGNIYQAIYNCVDFINYRYMSLYTPHSLLGGICAIFRRKARAVKAISASRNYLLVLDNKITVYRTTGGLYKEYALDCAEDYAGVQIIEDSPLLFCCIYKNGKRDFFDKRKILSKEFPVGDSFYFNRVPEAFVEEYPRQLFYANESSMLAYRPGESSHLVFVSFNNDQLRNFSNTRPVENFEMVVIHSTVRTLSVYNNTLAVLSDNKLTFYEILDSQRLLLNCRQQEIWTIFKNYGEIEFMVKFYELLAASEDVRRMEGICKNDSIKNHALFIFLYNLVAPILDADLNELLDSRQDQEQQNGASEKTKRVETIISKLTGLEGKIPMHFSDAREFITEFIQAYNYCTLLQTYGVTITETLAGIINKESNFRSETLKQLLATVSSGQSIEPLIKIMKNSCPLFLPLDQVNYQRGIDYLEKENGGMFAKSLECFLETRFDEAIIKRYNDAGYYYGSVVLIREKFNFSHEKAVALLSGSVKCRKAMDAGLVSTNETFLYPLFEVLLNLTAFAPCRCCESPETTVDLLRITNPLFLVFLKDKNTRNEKAYQLYWKYLLFRGKKAEAVKAIIGMCDSNLQFAKKIDLLEVGLTVASGITGQRSAEVRADLQSTVRGMLRLAEIQAELMERDPSTRTNCLLSADSLYNDYCYNHPDLGIKVLDAVNFTDKKVLRDLFARYFEGLPLGPCLAFIKELNNKDLALVVDLLIEKSADSTNFCGDLHDAGFSFEDVFEQVSAAISDSLHPSTKNRLIRSVEGFAMRKRAIEQNASSLDRLSFRMNK